MKITILHPSRNRAIRAHQAFSDWMFKASGKHDIEWIVSIDNDDQQADEYRLRFNPFSASIIHHNNRSLVDAVNRAAQVATGELLVVVSDDFTCPEGWDDSLAKLSKEEPCAIWVNDGYSYPKAPPDNRLLTLPILNQAAYKKLGYVYYPGYFSMFVDNDLFEVCDVNGWIVDAGHLLFTHNHPSIGLNPEDSTYLRQNSRQAWEIGKRLFEQRKSRGFTEFVFNQN